MTKNTSYGYINSNWSFNLVDGTFNDRIWIRTIMGFSKTMIWLGNQQSTNILALRK